MPRRKASLDSEIPRGETLSDWKARGQKTTAEGGNALEVEDYLN